MASVSLDPEENSSTEPVHELNTDELLAESVDNSEEMKYSYTKRKEFTSEIFKIEIGNLPNVYSVNHLKKLLLKLKLQPKKVKVMPRKNYAFVTFKCDEDRKQALVTLQNYEWRNKILTVKMAKPLADPVEKKRQEDDSSDTHELAKSVHGNDADAVLDVHTKLRSAVTPLWNKKYEEQIKMKYEVMTQVLRKLAKKLLGADVGNWVRQQRYDNQKMCCPLECILPSPLLEGYRNKCEFSIGNGVDDVGKVVGFRLGLYKDGHCTVVEPKECTNISDSMKQVLQEFQTYIRQSSLDSFNSRTHDGFWKQLTVRTNSTGDIMCILQIVPRDVTKSELEIEMEKLATYFRQQSNMQLTSLYLDVLSGSSGNNADENSPKLVLGEKFIYEHLCGMKFRISPNAFFQVNTKAAEILYKKIQEWSAVTSSTTILDICCGTGTIGLSMAKMAKKVIGVEVCPAAVEDARFNAESNGITNAQFVCGKAEDVIIETTNKLDQDSVVGIVDPPRAGCHTKVIHAIRRCPSLKRLIYVSCRPSSVTKDFIDLCRPATKKNKGEPFQIVKAVPVDLFPQTQHCELIVVLERA